MSFGINQVENFRVLKIKSGSAFHFHQHLGHEHTDVECPHETKTVAIQKPR